MRALLKTLGNAALVIVGFFAVFFSVSRGTHNTDRTSVGTNDMGIAHAEAPSSSDSSDSGSSDSGGK